MEAKDIYNFGSSPSEGEADAPTNENQKVDIQGEVQSALKSFVSTQQKEAEDADLRERQRIASEKESLETAAFQREREVILQSLREESNTNEEFKALVEKSSLPSEITEYLVYHADADEAPAFVAELAENTKALEDFSKASTIAERNKVFKKVRKAVQKKIQTVPEYTRSSVPSINYNNTPSGNLDDQMFDQVALNCGIC